MLPVIETFTEDMKQVNTLLQLATATRNILQKLTIKDIQVVTLPDNYFKFKFITEDGSTIETNSVFIGEAISIDDALSTVSTNPVQNKVITAAINTINESITTLQETSLNSAEKEFVSSEYTKTQGSAGAVMHAENVKGTIIWKNANPQAPLEAQSVNVARMDGYTILKFVYKLSTNTDTAPIEMLVKFANNSSITLPAFGDDGTLHFRQVTFTSATSVSYSIGHVGGVENYNALIPLAIYGIK